MLELERDAGTAADPAFEAEIQRAGAKLLATLRAAGGESLRRDAVTERLIRWAMGDEPRRPSCSASWTCCRRSTPSSRGGAATCASICCDPGMRPAPGSRPCCAPAAHWHGGRRSWPGGALRRPPDGAALHRRLELPRSHRHHSRLRRRGIGFTLDILGEAVTSEARGRRLSGAATSASSGCVADEGSSAPADSVRRGRGAVGPVRRGQRVAQAVVALLAVRPDRRRGQRRGGAGPAAPDPARWPRPGRDRSHRHGAVRHTRT